MPPAILARAVTPRRPKPALRHSHARALHKPHVTHAPRRELSDDVALVHHDDDRGHDRAHEDHADATAARYLPDPEERRRYFIALHRLTMGTITPQRLAERARLDHKTAAVKAALRADPRLQRVRDPIKGPERFVLRPEHRHASVLARRATA